jgi:predicted nuclease of predicted toxin-antitoxin system
VKLLVDMNLPPAWVPVLEAAGHQAVHWSSVGDPRAADSVVMDWARANGFVLFTHDLDFGALLAASTADGPSVIQIRTSDITPEAQATLLLEALTRFSEQLASGALVSLDEARGRVRILPIK